MNETAIKGSKLEYHLLPPEQLAGMAEIMNKGEENAQNRYMEINIHYLERQSMRHLNGNSRVNVLTRKETPTLLQSHATVSSWTDS